MPREGVTVKHIHTGEPLLVDRYALAQIIIMTISDFSEQLFSWQDTMFQNDDGKLHYAGNNPAVLWPVSVCAGQCGSCSSDPEAMSSCRSPCHQGPMKPGLWHSALSRLGLLLRSCLDDNGATAGPPTILGRPALPIPPVFSHCTELLLEADQQDARDAYWEAITVCTDSMRHDDAEKLLLKALGHNPHVAEPHVILSQIHLHRCDGYID